MRRPAVTVVMPFAGQRREAVDAAARLRGLELCPGDHAILVDNSGTANGVAGVRVVLASGERSPAHARNVGAAAAGGEWILFIDSDCRPRPELLDAYFAEPIEEQVGALAGEVVGVPEPSYTTDESPSRGPRLRRHRSTEPPLAARYGATKSFLSQRQHLAHPYRPRAVAANLLVRRAAFEHVGGFFEGLRAGEDTDFTWRLQQAGWRLELRPDAWVEHRYRNTISDLRRQWRGYAAGRAWLARRYEGFVPERALARALRRVRRRADVRRSRPDGRALGAGAEVGRVERGKYLAIDAVLALEEVAGFLLSNRPSSSPPGDVRAGRANVVFIADRFPSPGDPLIELPSALGARVEAAGRPRAITPDAHGLHVRYREDDGLAERLLALVRILVAHPLRCLRDELHRGAGETPLIALAPAARRLQQDRDARVAPLGRGEAPAVVRRLEALAGRRAR